VGLCSGSAGVARFWWVCDWVVRVLICGDCVLVAVMVIVVLGAYFVFGLVGCNLEGL